MSTVTETIRLRSNGERTGSHALQEPPYGGVAEPGGSVDAWRDAWVQSSAITPSGLAWGLAILGALASESESMTAVRIVGVGAVHGLSSETALQSDQARQAIALLEQWLADKSDYDEQTWPQLRRQISPGESSAELATIDPQLPDILLSFAGKLRGLPEDLAEKHDDYIHGDSNK